MSASRMPTFAPSCPSATARFRATVLLPTPPFPAPTSTMFFTPGVRAASATPRAPRGPLDVLPDGLAERTGGSRELHLEANGSVLHAQVLHHPEAHDVAVELGIHHLLQRFEGGLGIEGHVRVRIAGARAADNAGRAVPRRTGWAHSSASTR